MPKFMRIAAFAAALPLGGAGPGGPKIGGRDTGVGRGAPVRGSVSRPPIFEKRPPNTLGRAPEPPLLARGARPPGGGSDEAPPRSDKPVPEAGQAGPREIMAYVNGRAVGMEQLSKILVQSYGRPVAQQLVGLELAKQAAAKKGLSVTEKEVDEEHARTVRELFRSLGPAGPFEEHLDRFLAQKNMSRALWQVIMRRNALLRKLAPREVPVSEVDIRQEFGRRYGRKVVVRHIQASKLADAQKAKELADKGIDFTLLVTRYSTHESRNNGGLLPPIGRDTVQLTPALRNVALAMKKIGEISNPIQAGTRWHILKLEKIIEPKGVNYADVKKEIAASLREGRIRIFQNQMLQKLIAEAKIEYVNPILKEQEDKAKAEAEKKPE